MATAITTRVFLSIFFASVCAFAFCEDVQPFWMREEDCHIESGDRGCDVCEGLLSDIKACPGSSESIAEGRYIVSRFMSMPYASLPASHSRRTVDFELRLKCLAGMCAFSWLRNDDGVLVAIEAHIVGLKPLPTEQRAADMMAARELLLHMNHTPEQIAEFRNFKPDGKTMRGALLTHPAYDGFLAAIRKEYDARDRYNKSLEAYKKAALEILRSIRESRTGENAGE